MKLGSECLEAVRTSKVEIDGRMLCSMRKIDTSVDPEEIIQAAKNRVSQFLILKPSSKQEEMVLYNFKTITTVPTATEFIDVMLSKTQRKTPTVVHPSYAITRIRAFYMRKVKYTQQNCHDKLSLILDQFPLLTDIHPFYADLINILYDRDHYKLALGQLNTARHLVDQIANDYLKLLKYGDSLYRCKQLKKAALGRMATLIKRHTSSLAYLEQVRQHLSRLPSIDPNTRTLVLCGYPNVGKSSFLNKVTRADVEVQPYPFTTKSLFVGHTDYEYLRWQVIDTPGILDHPLDQRNTIEMQSITALAHLRAAVLFVIDISEQCGYSLETQANLFHSIKPLFTNKPLLICANKIDVQRFEDLGDKAKKIINKMTNNGEIPIVPMSTMTEEGVSAVKKAACDTLLANRVEAKMSGKKSNDILSRIHLATPTPRDDKDRSAIIPESVKNRMQKISTEADNYVRQYEENELLKPIWEQHFGSLEWKKRYKLKDDEWRFDVVPEIVNGQNIADFVDPDILAKLEELEAEEETRLEALEKKRLEEDPEMELTEEQAELVKEIRDKKLVQREIARTERGRSHAIMPRNGRTKGSIDDMEDQLEELGMDPSKAVEGARSRSQSRGPGNKRTRSASVSAVLEGAGEEMLQKRQRLSSKSPGRDSGLKDIQAKEKVEGVAKKNQKKMGKAAKKGESDRHIPNLKPKHLFSGKRGRGTADHR
ncbi:putative nucleolar GTP-binding protein 1-like [Planoprotostelium fungivorum]|uniref:Putative nucleolar GTP-binding protein 1-like n=1 Tax=Planoprotostelium fungivorum TaxID=1890364 RepID=A0A2P6NUU0_9EUKA|nr:putative nucleolar GTP-binding protein 1-like [Planoprotostelium fungivorum]